MTIHDVLLAQFNANQSNIARYQADLNNILGMLNDLNLQQQAITTWLASNPA